MREHSKKYSFAELQELIRTTELHVYYDNDYWELNRYPANINLTDEQLDEKTIVCCGGYEDNVDLETFPKHEVYYPNCYANGIMVLLAHTPNHKIKSVGKV